jgi:hypothetical protein
MTNDTFDLIVSRNDANECVVLTPSKHLTPYISVDGKRYALADLLALLPLADAACDYADQHCRWFDISTAPDEEGLSFLVSIEIRNPSTIWREVHVVHLNEDGEIHTDCHQGWSLGDYTHWAPLPPLPLNPPSPAVFVELGAALERLKSQP